MLRRMEAVISLRAGATLAQIDAVLRQHRVRARPMHPGVADAALAAWYVLEGPGDAALQAAIQALQTHPAVDAAIIKPAGEAPG